MSKNLSRLFLIAVLVLQFPVAEVTSPEAGLSADTRSTAPSKLCHPKKPVTCRANDFAEAAPAVAPTAEQRAALCFGPRWLCRTGTDLATPAQAAPLPEAPVAEPLTDSTLESQQAALCFGPRWLCRTGTDLATPAEGTALPEAPVAKRSTESKLESQQAALCFGPRWLCRSSEGLI